LPSKNQSLSGLQDIFTGIPSHKRYRWPSRISLRIQQSSFPLI
jgi:hypothetical protein